MAPNVDMDINQFTQIALNSSQWSTLEPHLQSDKNGISDVNVFFCADYQTFGANINVSIDVDRCSDDKPVRYLYRILFM